MRKTSSSHTKRKIAFSIAAAIFAAIIIACAIYLNDYYHASLPAFAALKSSEEIRVEPLPDGSLVFQPREAKAGFIFYPGGKVEHTAYAPLMHACAERGILSVLIKMPFQLAVLDQNAADGIAANYPEIKDWYIGGHSLGGAMAASYAASHAEAMRGLVLLAAYSTSDLSKSGIEVLSLYGSEDGVLNGEKYAQYRENLPNAALEEVILGGCHSGFGFVKKTRHPNFVNSYFGHCMTPSVWVAQRKDDMVSRSSGTLDTLAAFRYYQPTTGACNDPGGRPRGRRAPFPSWLSYHAACDSA